MIAARAPQVVYWLLANGHRDTTKWVPGGPLDRWAGRVVLSSFEYTDVWTGGFDQCTFTFEDPELLLADSPNLKTGIGNTCVQFRFGYGGALSEQRTMTLYRVMPKYNENGQVQTQLMFFVPGIEARAFRLNYNWVSERCGKSPGQFFTAADIAVTIARKYGLNPCIAAVPSNPTNLFMNKKQANVSDWDFLTTLAGQVKNQDGKSSANFRLVFKNYDLIFGPKHVPDVQDVVYTFSYRQPNAIIRSFSPSLPSDVLIGMGNLSVSGGIEDETGQNRHDQRLQTGDSEEVNFKTGYERAQTTEGAHRAPRLNAKRTHAPSPAQRNARAKTVRDQANLALEGITVAKLVLSRQIPKPTPAQIDAALAPDRARYRATLALAASIEHGTKDPSTTTVYEGACEAETDSDTSLGLMNQMTGSLTLFGFPLVEAGREIIVNNVGKRFGGKWWAKEVKHRIDAQTGFTTTMEVQRTPLGLDMPVSQRPGLVDVVRVVNWDNNTEQWGIRPSQRLLDMITLPATVTTGSILTESGTVLQGENAAGQKADVGGTQPSMANQ